MPRRTRTSPRSPRGELGAVVRMTPSLAGSTSTTTGSPAASEAETIRSVVASGCSSYDGTAILRPVSRSSVEPGRGTLRQCHPHLVDGRGDEQVPADDPRDEQLHLVRRTATGQGEQPADERLAKGQVERAGTSLAHEYAELGQPQVLAAVLLRSGQPQQPGFGTSCPARPDVLGSLLDHVGEHRPDLGVQLTGLLTGFVVRHRGPFTSETVTCSSLVTEQPQPRANPRTGTMQKLGHCLGSSLGAALRAPLHASSAAHFAPASATTPPSRTWRSPRAAG